MPAPVFRGRARRREGRLLGGWETLRGSRWMLLSFGTSLFLQATYFILLARLLGPRDFGLFSAGLAICTVLGCLGGLGSGNALLQMSSRNPGTTRAAWANAMRLNAITLIPLALVASLLLSPLAAPWWMPLVLVMTEVVVVRVVDTSMQLRQSRGELRSSALINLGLSAAKLCAAGLAMSLAAGLMAWLLIYLGAMALVGAAAITRSRRALTHPDRVNVTLSGTVRTGAPFAIGMASRSLHVDADKYMMARLSTDVAAGNYSVASRLVTMAFIPIQAVAYSSNRDLFIAGADGLRPAWARGRHLLRLSIGLAAVAATCLALLAPLVPLVMGGGYAESVRVIQLLSPVLVLQAVYTILGDILMGAGRQWVRSLMQFAAGVSVVAMNIVAIPRWGAQGAAGAAVLGGLVLCATLAVTLAVTLRSEDATRSSRAV